MPSKKHSELHFRPAVRSVAAEEFSQQYTRTHRKVGGIIASGCLAIAMTPALAFAFPTQAAPTDDNAQLPQMPAVEMIADGQMPADGELPPAFPDGQLPPDYGTGEMPSGELPAMPSGEMPADGQMPPAMPAGQMPSGELPAMPGGQMAIA